MITFNLLFLSKKKELTLAETVFFKEIPATVLICDGEFSLANSSHKY